MTVVFLGIDLAKNVFALHGVAWQFAGFGCAVHAFSPGRIDPKPCGRV